jgi:hypothetical protein
MPKKAKVFCFFSSEKKAFLFLFHRITAGNQTGWVSAGVQEAPVQIRPSICTLPSASTVTRL